MIPKEKLEVKRKSYYIKKMNYFNEKKMLKNIFFIIH